MDNIIIKTVTRLLVPFIQLYALYVVAHGDLGAGGGFQGGVIFGSSIILYALAFGAGEGRKRMSERVNDILGSAGVLIFAGIGVLCIVFGGMFLEYESLPLGHHLATHLGVYGIEIGVAITVSAVMATIYFEMVRQSDD
ncbi:MAG: Na(+)/H(+) antiporter subunit B [Thermodesulfobacteriota bacterium]|nr:MAG: Na(+)/H(+) antiporter subunit B [Thermodesulfobacteriota bacterium]